LNCSTWKDLYDGDVQGVYALIAVPVLFLIYRMLRGRPSGGGALPAAARFVDGYAVVFAIQTILDPVVTGPLARALGISQGVGGTVLLVLFVLLGDFRVYLLVFGVLAIAAGRRWTDGLGVAAAWTTAVPIVAYAANAALHAAVPGLDATSIWPIYETLFAAVALTLRARLVPARVPPAQPGLRSYLRDGLLYVAIYYASWAFADLLIQVGGFDVGWLVRVLPNQLYYALWVPAAFFAFFAPRYQSTSASTQAAR
jgi:hypothetical protein